MDKLIRQSVALAYMRAGEHDIRPDLLLFVVLHEHEPFPRLFSYGCHYIEVWLARHGQTAPKDAIRLAVNDALAIVLTRRAPCPLRERAKEIGIRQRTFRALRAKALQMFERRYHEAVVRYRQASRGIDLHPQIGSLEKDAA